MTVYWVMLVASYFLAWGWGGLIFFKAYEDDIDKIIGGFSIGAAMLVFGWNLLPFVMILWVLFDVIPKMMSSFRIRLRHESPLNQLEHDE